MRRPRSRSLLLWLLVAILAAFGWHAFAPEQIGGSTTYLATEGDSMAPRFERGDLVLVRPAPRYSVGDVVAYHHPKLGHAVIHRIVAIRGGRYVLRGDNNDYLDSVQPGREALIGKPWLRVPNAGHAVVWASGPVRSAGLLGLATLLTIVGWPERRRRRSGGRLPGGPVRRLALDIDSRRVALVVAGVVGLAALLLGIVAFARPSSEMRAVELYRQTGTFTYGAPGSAGEVYEPDGLRSGDPAYLRLVDALNVRFAYRAEPADGGGELSGTAILTAELSRPDGWHRRFVLDRPRRFADGAVTLAGRLSLTSLIELIDRVDALTEAPSRDYRLTLAARVRAEGNGGSVSSMFAPELPFRLDRTELQLLRSSTGEAPRLVRTGSVSEVREVSRHVEPLGLAITVTAARVLAVAGVLVALLAAGGLLWLARRDAPDGEAEQIRARYRSRLVTVVSGQPLAERAAVEVETIEALADIADRAGQPILHDRGGADDVYLVVGEGVSYRYRGNGR